MRVVGYCRCSTQDQAEGGVGLSVQERAIRQWCLLKGHELIRVHVDTGVSGAADIGQRPGLLDAISSLEASGALVVAKRDRLARDVVIAAMIERMVERSKARVLSCDGLNGNGPEGQLLRTIVDAVAQYERALIQTRTRAALAHKRARGERISRFEPYGYRFEGNDLKPVKREQEAIILMQKLRVQGHSLRQIGRELESRGIKTKQGRTSWTASAVQKALQRSASY